MDAAGKRAPSVPNLLTEVEVASRDLPMDQMKHVEATGDIVPLLEEAGWRCLIHIVHFFRGGRVGTCFWTLC